jgi:hypothetical protein
VTPRVEVAPGLHDLADDRDARSLGALERRGALGEVDRVVHVLGGIEHRVRRVVRSPSEYM